METQSNNAAASQLDEGQEPNKFKIFFERFSLVVTRVTGRPIAFIVALLMVVIWALSGPIFHFSETWQLVINTSTTIITFLMVFLIQQAQNKDTVALHLKLNELIAANKRASNRLINVEDLTEDELTNLKNFFVNLSNHKAEDLNNFALHSVDEGQLKDTAGELADQLHQTLTASKDLPDKK